MAAGNNVVVYAEDTTHNFFVGDDGTLVQHSVEADHFNWCTPAHTFDPDSPISFSRASFDPAHPNYRVLLFGGRQYGNPNGSVIAWWTPSGGWSLRKLPA